MTIHYTILFYITYLLLFAVLGCDPVREARQTCTIRVADAQSGNPITGTTVHLKRDFYRDEAELDGLRKLSEDMREDTRQFWDRLPWSTGITNVNGQADFVITTLSLDRTRGSIPPPERDVITAKPYLVKIPAIQDDDEELSIVMKLDERVVGPAYSVSVIRINPPKYVESR